MAYRSQEWKTAIYRGQSLTGIRQHKEDDTKFLFIIFIKKSVRKRIMTITGEESERYQKAIFEYAQFRSDIYQGYFLQPVTFGEMFEKWISLKQSTRWTKSQIGVYHHHIQQHIGYKNLRDIKARDIDTVMIGVKSLSDRTRKNILAIVKSVLMLAVDEKHLKKTPLEPRHSVTVNALEQKTLILDAMNLYKTVYQSIMRIFAIDPKWRCIFLFGINGRRKTEILLMEWKHISLVDKTYIIPGRHSKVKQSLSFVLPGDVMTALKEIRPDNPSGLVFPNQSTGGVYTDIRTKVQLIRDDTGWSQFGFHRMRNLTSSALFANGVEAGYLSSLLGHTNPATLQQYLTLQRVEACEIVEDASQRLLNQRIIDKAI